MAAHYSVAAHIAAMIQPIAVYQAQPPCTACLRSQVARPLILRSRSKAYLHIAKQFYLILCLCKRALASYTSVKHPILTLPLVEHL